jgi:hypothetical protein
VSRYNNSNTNPPENIHCIETEYNINPYIILIPKLLCVTIAIALNATNPKINPLKNNVNKLNQNIEFIK